MQHNVSYYKLASKATMGHNQLTENINLFTYFRSLITDMKINLSFKLQNTALCKRFAKPWFKSAKHEIPFCIGLQAYGSNCPLQSWCSCLWSHRDMCLDNYGSVQPQVSNWDLKPERVLINARRANIFSFPSLCLDCYRHYSLLSNSLCSKIWSHSGCEEQH